MVGLLDNDGFTAFDLSLRGGHEETSMLFYKSVIDMDNTHPQEALLRALTVTSEPAEGRPVFPGLALFDPVESRNTSLVKALIHRGVDLTARNENGDTALHVAAAIKDHVEIAEMLLEAGSDVNAVGHGGVTALHYAADEKMVRVLRDWSADVAAGDNHGRSALNIVQENEKEDLVAVLSGVTEIAPVFEILDDDAERTEMVRRRWPNGIEAKNERQITPLMQALVNENLDTMRVLLELGADSESTSWGLTSLQGAANRGFVGGIHILLASGAQINRADIGQTLPLHWAAMTGHTEAVKALLVGGAQIDLSNSSGNTALYLAAERGHTNSVKVLLAGGAQIGSADSRGMTILHLAAQLGHTDVVKALLAGGSEIHFVDYRGHSVTAGSGARACRGSQCTTRPWSTNRFR